MTYYASFEELQKHESMEVDYRIRFRKGKSGIAIMAIHGGGIEPGTTEIAEAVAGMEHSFYTFSGLKKASNARLHINSRKFDEPRGMEIANGALTAILIHGCRDADPTVYLGGRHGRLKACIGAALKTAGFAVLDSRRFPGINPKNICNKNKSGMGVQLEISLALRKSLFYDIARLHRKRPTPGFARFIFAIRTAIADYLASTGDPIR